MAFEAPTDNFNPDGFRFPAPGDYHVQLTHVDEDGGKQGEMICDFEVLAGTTPNQEGKSHREYFQKTMKAFQRIHTLAVALGMVTVDELKKLKAANKSPVYDFPAAVGKQLCMGLVDDVYEGKHRTKCNFQMFAVADEKVATWPKNSAMLAKAGIVLPERPGAAEVGNALKGL